MSNIVHALIIAASGGVIFWASDKWPPFHVMRWICYGLTGVSALFAALYLYIGLQ